MQSDDDGGKRSHQIVIEGSKKETNERADRRREGEDTGEG